MSLISGLTVIALSSSAGCGGRSEDSHNARGGGVQVPEGGASSGGHGGVSPGGHAGTSPGGFAGGAPGFGGMTAAATGGAAQGGQGAEGGTVCVAILSAYGASLENAQRCDPSLSVEQCTQEMGVGLACGCTAFVNPANVDALVELNETAAAFSENGCTLNVSCLPCLQPRGGHCSPEGRCENVYVTERGCEVGGVRYASGANGIPDPVSCNTCGCRDGDLVCTEIGCARPCPAGTAFGTSCAQCGPTDACQVLAYACYETCVDRCDDIGTVCIGGLCKPGFCG